MPAGRPPKPIEQKRRTGNPGKRRLPAKSKTVALMPADGVPPVPVKLGETGTAAWMRVWQSPARAWLSPELDILTVESVCALAEEVAELRELYSSQRLLVEPIVTPAGAVVGERLVPNPAEKMLRGAEKQLAQELSSLGFNPTARARLGLAEVKRQSKVQELLERSRAGEARREEGAGQEDGEEVFDAEIVDLAADS